MREVDIMRSRYRRRRIRPQRYATMSDQVIPGDRRVANLAVDVVTRPDGRSESTIQHVEEIP